MPEEKMNEKIKIATEFKRAEDFLSSYANNVMFETSVFDIKIVFGELLQPYGGKPFVEQRSATTLSWLEAKIAALFLIMNVAMHEKQFGPLVIPEGTMPLDFSQTSEERELPLVRLMELVEQRPPVKPAVAKSELKTQ
ncbi:MAG: DUF3467 domain-containing protein [Terriglobales bacterium]